MSQSERLRARLERRRSSAASPHRNRSKFYKGSRDDWKGLVMWETVETGLLMEDIVVQREGSSQRTVKELSIQFVKDALDIAISDCGTVAGTASIGEMKALESLLDEAVDSTDSLDALDDIVLEVESRLSDMGYVVEWNDGYIIYAA